MTHSSRTNRKGVPASQTRRGSKHREVAVPQQRFRVEGLGRRGRVMHVHIVGRAGSWRIFGSAGFRLDVQADTVDDVLRITRRKLPFRPIAVREVDAADSAVSDDTNAIT